LLFELQTGLHLETGFEMETGLKFKTGSPEKWAETSLRNMRLVWSNRAI
jgi:hypothetical protein